VARRIFLSDFLSLPNKHCSIAKSSRRDIFLLKKYKKVELAVPEKGRLEESRFGVSGGLVHYFLQKDNAREAQKAQEPSTNK
jgi:hypothetical protein